MSTQTVEQDEYRAVAEEAGRQLAKQFPDLTVELAGSWVWVSGNTRAHKDELKAAGLNWCRSKSKWYLKGRPSVRFGKRSMDWGYIVFKYGAEAISDEVTA